MKNDDTLLAVFCSDSRINGGVILSFMYADSSFPAEQEVVISSTDDPRRHDSICIRTLRCFYYNFVVD